MNQITKGFICAIGATPPPDDLISVKFKNRSEWEPFTVAVLALLKSDPAVDMIVSEATGEILYNS